VAERQTARQRADRARALALRMATVRDRADTLLAAPLARAAGPDSAAEIYATFRAVADFSAAQYTDPDWRRFPWWRRAFYAVSWRPFLALERQFFVKPRLIHEKLLAHLNQSALTIALMWRVIDTQEERIGLLCERVRALEAAAADGRYVPRAAPDRARAAP
jgi:hypothetical protein